MLTVAHLYRKYYFLEKKCLFRKKTEEIQFPEYAGAIGDAGGADRVQITIKKQRN